MLAWNRTVLAVLVSGAALARWTVQGSTALGFALLGLVLVGAPVALTALDWRQRAIVADLRAGRPLLASHRLIIVVTVLVVGIGGLELVHLVTL